MIAKKYKKKPVEIEAFQWKGLDEQMEMIKEWTGTKSVKYNLVNKSVVIPTPEGFMTANIGDMIIRGIKGEVYPCKKDIFDLTYDPA